MKTAKEITEDLVKEQEYEEKMQTYLILVTHEEGYWTKLQNLEMIRKFILKFEYYPNEDVAMKGMEDALKWVLSDETKDGNSI